MPKREVAADDDGRRFDRVLRTAFPGVPPGAIAGAIRRGEATINGERAQNDSRVQTGDVVSIPAWEQTGSDQIRRPAVRAWLEGDEIVSGRWRIPVVQRTSDWIALIKPQGIASHGAGALDDIVRSAALAEGWWDESLSFRPGPVHRLDTNTSGLQLFSLSAVGARDLVDDIRRRRGCKVYLGFASGRIERRQLIQDRLAWDRGTRVAVAERNAPDSHRLRFATAQTMVAPLATVADGSLSLVAAIPVTGRTHQIRCHLAAIGHPLAGDYKYSGPTWYSLEVGAPAHPGGGEAYLLHAYALYLPAMGRGLSAPLPRPWFGMFRSLFGDAAPITTRLTALVQEACPDAKFSGTLPL